MIHILSKLDRIPSKASRLFRFLYNMSPETQEEVGPSPTVRTVGMVDIIEEPGLLHADAAPISELMDMLEDPVLSHADAGPISEMMDMLEDSGLSHAVAVRLSEMTDISKDPGCSHVYAKNAAH